MRHYLQTEHRAVVTLEMDIDELETLIDISMASLYMGQRTDAQTAVLNHLRTVYNELRMKNLAHMKPQRREVR